jgi:hypothetical protein
MDGPVEGSRDELAPEILPYDYNTDRLPAGYVNHMRESGLPLFPVSNEMLYEMLVQIEKRLARLEGSG